MYKPNRWKLGKKSAVSKLGGLKNGSFKSKQDSWMDKLLVEGKWTPSSGKATVSRVFDVAEDRLKSVEKFEMEIWKLQFNLST